MRRNRIILLLAAVALMMLAFSPSALAITHNGEGLYGPTNDLVITYTMFIIIALLCVIIVVFSLIQSWLDHRKHARMDAAKRRESAIEWKGGW